MPFQRSAQTACAGVPSVSIGIVSAAERHSTVLLLGLALCVAVFVAVKISAQLLRQFLVVFLYCQIERLALGLNGLGGMAGLVVCVRQLGEALPVLAIAQLDGLFKRSHGPSEVPL